MKKNIIKYLITAVITAVLTAVITLCCVKIYFIRMPLSIKNIAKVVNIIDETYVGTYDSNTMEKYVMSAIVSSIGDEYAAYYDGDSAEDTMNKIEGHYVGVGLEVFANTEKNKIEVVSAYKDAPADKAGIKKGDYIVEIDGKKYNAYNLEKAVVHMKGNGKKDSEKKEVQIVIERNGEYITKKLKREKINIYKVESETIENICYIKLGGFSLDSVKAVKKILNELDTEKTEGVIVDVRDNLGGVFSSAIDLCDMFLEDGTIMYTMDKKGNKKVYKATKKACELPLTVLVNGETASASEIFAGSMQGNKRAVIIGEKTYGKGVSQTIQYINNLDKSEGALKLTTDKNYTPDGKWINEAINPDIEVKSSEENVKLTEDAAVLAAIKSIKKENEDE